MASQEPHLTILKMDFRKLGFREEYDAVVSLSNSLSYKTREDDVAAIQRMANALRPGKGLLLDLLNLVEVKAGRMGKSWEETPNEYVLHECALDDEGQRMVTRDVIAPKLCGSPRAYTSSFLLYQPDQVKQLMESAGLRDIRFYGDACTSDAGPLFSEEGFNEKSNVMIVTGRNPDPE